MYLSVGRKRLAGRMHRQEKGNAMCKRTDNCTYLTVSALQDDALHSVFISRFTSIAGHFLF